MSPSGPELVARLLELNVLKGFDAASLEHIQAEITLVQLAAGAVLFHKGDAGDSLYVLNSGRLDVLIQTQDGVEQAVDELGPGAYVGEMALLTGQPRAATVRAAEACELVRLSRSGFDQLTRQNPLMALQLAESIVPRLQRTLAVDALSRIFGSLSVAALHALQAELTWHHVAGGSTIFCQGDPGDSLYLILNGRVRLLAEDGGNVRPIGEVGRGESLGEFALLTGEPRSATAQAIRDTAVARLPVAAFERLVAHYPQAMTQIARIIIRRGASTLPPQHVVATAMTFAVISAEQEQAWPVVIQDLIRALSALGPTLHLSSSLCDQILGKHGIAQTSEDHPASAAFAAWLNEQELTYRYIVYEADAEWSPWTGRCVRQADRVLLLGWAERDAAPGEVETQVGKLGGMPRMELILAHPADTIRPTGTRHWLAKRQVQALHHLRLHAQPDMERLARRLTGHAIGLLLGGGGARGYAHIGVIRAFEEAGIPIDIIGGVSIGALGAACYGVGMDARTMTVASKRHGSPRALFDYTLPLVAFFASKKLMIMLNTFFGTTEIEDLWQPFFCVASNLSRGVPVVFDRGPLAKAVRASLALPGVFSPVLKEDDILVDGGVLNNLPVEIMREYTAGGTVIAVNVRPRIDQPRQYAFDDSVSGWSVLWRRLNPWMTSLRVPSILATMTRAATLNNVQQEEAQRRMADIYIAPQVGHFSMLDFRPVEAIAEAGYRAAKIALEEWRTREQD